MVVYLTCGDGNDERGRYEVRVTWLVEHRSFKITHGHENHHVVVIQRNGNVDKS